MKSLIFASYWGSPVVQFSKFQNFLWVCWFLGKNLSNLIYPVWKLHNPYCHKNHTIWHKTRPSTYWHIANPLLKESSSLSIFPQNLSLLQHVGMVSQWTENIFESWLHLLLFWCISVRSYKINSNLGFCSTFNQLQLR